VFVPVVNQKQEPLMPTTSWRASRWILSGKATGFFNKGVFCVRLNQKPSNNIKQEIAVGIDPGSKKEAFTVKSRLHTYLNVQTDAITWVKEAVESRRNARRSRRNRNTPCRKLRFNRSKGNLSPSTKARWQWKLRILNWLKKMFPVSFVVVEDVKAKTKGQKRWDKSFSPLEVGKQWFYKQIANLDTKNGYETYEMRQEMGLKKLSNKMSNKFEAHCVDSWVLANWKVGGHVVPDNKEVVQIVPLQFHRRQLHMFQPNKQGKRKEYGGTRSLGWKRGSLVKHVKLGLVFIGGSSKGKLSLHSLVNGRRLTQYSKKEECVWLCYLTFRKVGDSSTA
jgi:hypothetical protein